MSLPRIPPAVLVALIVLLPGETSWPASSSEPFHFVAFGDMPYHTPRDYLRMQNVVDAINAAHPVFAIHVGDLKGGGRLCDQETYARVKSYFDAIDPALVYTPGDNDWSDCDRLAAGGYDPRERLAFLRRMFFPEPRSLGRAPIAVERQSDRRPEDGLPENLTWDHGGIVFATIHVVGADDNLSDDPEEFEARRKANLAWIDEAFTHAAALDSTAVVIALQADMFRPFASDAAFGGIRNALARAADAFGRPVLLINGDGHTYTVDRPLGLPGSETPLPNVTRVEVFGDEEMHAVRIDVDPDAAEVFTVTPLYVEANR